MEAYKFPKLSTRFGLKVMATSGEIFKRVDNITKCEAKGNFLLCSSVIETVTSIKDGQITLLPVFEPNNIFTDVNGQGFLRATEKTEEADAAKAAENGLGYIIVRNNQAEAWLNGEKVPFPTTLWNELGVDYKFVDYKAYGEVCKRIHGYYIAKKVEPIYVFDTAAGDKVQAVINGVKEHETYVEEGETKVQNMYHGETYKMRLKKLRKLYVFDSTTADGIQIWKPRDEKQTWTFTNENVFGVLWGGFEFLAKAMINLTDPEDVYGCNYEVFNGNDLAKGSHLKLKLFMPLQPMPKTVLNNLSVCAGSVEASEAIPKMETEYIEVPLPMDLYAKIG